MKAIYLVIAVALAALLATAGAARADTFGLPPWMKFAQEWKENETAIEKPEVVVARTAGEWAAFWKRHKGQDEPAPKVDFDNQMVVGVVGDKEDKACVYRVELDDAAAPRQLMVRVAPGESFCQKPVEKREAGTRVCLAVTPKSALEVEFTLDAMADGQMFPINGGVQRQELGKAPALKGELKGGKAEYREQAEKAVRDTLTAAEVAAARMWIWPASHGKAYPEEWSIIHAERQGGSWRIWYDFMCFSVDSKTAQVTREKGNSESWWKEPEIKYNWQLPR